MDFLELLKSQKIDLFQVFRTYKLDEIKESLNEIVSNSKGYEELKNNPVANNNFFTVLSNVILIEQNKQQNGAAADAPVTLSLKIDKNFKEKINQLSNEPVPSNFSR